MSEHFDGQKNEYTHADFTEKFLASLPAVWFVGHWLWLQKYDVKIFKYRLAEKHEDWEEFSDAGDLEITRPNGDVLRCEAKAPTYKFGVGDWPHGKYFIVDQRSTWDLKEKKPHLYFFLAPDRKTIISLRGESRKHWYVEERKVKKTKLKREYYFCPMEHLEWHSL
jgi:hypothetical protein